jgi:nuclear pore complex protein Nup160
MFTPGYFSEEHEREKRPSPINLPLLPATVGGEIMEGSAMFNLYKESSIDLGQVSDQSVVTIPIPRAGLAGAWLPSPKRAVRNERAACKDENTFANHFLATEGSVYFRDHKRSPRSFLWRVLDEHKVLELRCADLTRSHHEGTNEAYLTLRIEFDEAILPSCVALADPPDHDVLNVFILSSSKTLYTLTLRPDFFRRPKASSNAQDWCKTFQPPLFGSPFPHRLHAGTATEVFFSLDDGSLVRLRRKSGDDGMQPVA